jgi:prephenate dehydratase
VVEARVEDEASNTTRFLVLGKPTLRRPGATRPRW